jgi:endonuclease/exonuclease/phosphatase family metal-dependent hydrolase
MRSLRPLLALTLWLSIGVLASPAPGLSAENGKKVTFMTRNLYLGADLAPVIGAILGGGNVLGAAGDAWANVQATSFPTRAVALAEEIKAEKPDFIGLQEAVTWSVGVPFDPAPASTVVYDFVGMLQSALVARGLHYDVVVIAEEFAAEVPGIVPDSPYLVDIPGIPYPLPLYDIRLQDRDVLLVKHGGQFQVTNASSHHFVNNLDLGFAVETRGWVQADVTVGPREFRLVNTHFTNEHPGVRYLQAGELLAGPCSTSLPVVLLGDFNADGNDPGGVGSGAPYNLIRGAGFGDAWVDEHPGDPGLTFGQEPTLTVPTWPSTGIGWPAEPVERIDFVLFRGGGITAYDADIFGKSVGDMFGGLWPTDHAGVAATLRIP